MKKQLAVLAAGVLLLTTACGSDDEGGSGSDASTYRVVFSGAVSDSGPLGDTSQTMLTAAKASVADVNAAGGIDGREVKLEVVDDKGDPTEALTKLREVLAKGKPDLFLSSGPSPVTAAVLPVLTQNSVLSFTNAPTEDSADPEVAPYNFDLAPTVTSLAMGPASWAANEGFETVGILHGSSPTGQLYGKIWPDQFEGEGIEVVANEEYDITALDMTAQLEKIKSKAPDALVIDGYGAPVGYVLQGVQKLGWDVPMIGDGSVASTSLMIAEEPDGLVGTPDVENLLVTVFASARRDDDDTRVNDAVASMADAGDLKTSLMTAMNYDALFLVAAAAESAGSTDLDDLVTALEDADVTAKADTAVIPHYAYSDANHGFDVPTDAFAFVPPSVMTNGQFVTAG